MLVLDFDVTIGGIVELEMQTANEYKIVTSKTNLFCLDRCQRCKIILSNPFETQQKMWAINS